MFKIFLKLLGVTQTQIRILGSGSVKKFIKTENANDSVSRRGPDPRITPNWIRMHLDPDSWIRIQEFLCGPQIRIGSVPHGTGSPPPDLIGLEPLLYVGVTRHLDHPWEAGNAMPCSPTMPSRSGKSQTRKIPCLPLPSYGKPSPEPTRHERDIYFSPACRFGVFSQDD